MLFRSLVASVGRQLRQIAALDIEIEHPNFVCVTGDFALAHPERLDFDFVFLDAWKPDYKKFFGLVFPRVTPRGLFLAHNVVNKQSEMKDFLAAIADSSSIATTIVRPGSEGMSVSVKLK